MRPLLLAPLVLLAACATPAEKERAALEPFLDRLVASHTKSDLIVFMGLPKRCEPLPGDLEACEWQIGESRWETRRGGTLLFPVGGGWVAGRGRDQSIQVSRALRVTCLLPADGSVRAPGSCQWRLE